MSIKTYIVVVLVLLGVGYALGKYTTPERVVTQTITKIVTVTQHDTQTVIVEKPDGTKTTIIIDKSKDTTKQQQTDTKTVENIKPQWHVSAQLVPQQGLLGPVYGLQIERRIIGPVHVGVFGNTDKEFGLSVGVDL